MPTPVDVTTAAELDTILSASKDRLTVIDFHASWCGPCHAIAPVFTRIAEASQATFVRVDVDQAKQLAQRYQVSAMPTFVFLKNAKVVDTLRGANPRGLQTLVNKHSGETISNEQAGDLQRPSLLDSLKQNPWPIVIAVMYLLYKWYTDNGEQEQQA